MKFFIANVRGSDGAITKVTIPAENLHEAHEIAIAKYGVEAVHSTDDLDPEEDSGFR